MNQTSLFEIWNSEILTNFQYKLIS